VELDTRLYVWLTVVAATVSLGLVIPVNLVFGLTPEVNLGALIFGGASVALHLLTRRGRYFPRLFCGLFVALINLAWFADAGADGAAPLWFTLGATLVVLFFRGAARWVALGLFVLDGVGLTWLDYRYPELALRPAIRLDRYLDLVTGFPLAEVTCAVMFAIVLKGYRDERRLLTEANQALERTLSELSTLRGLLPVCGWCKKIRDDQGAWVQLETYVSERTQAAFSHGICPDCAQRNFNEAGGQLAPP